MRKRAWYGGAALGVGLSLTAVGTAMPAGAQVQRSRKVEVIQFWSSGPTAGVQHVVDAFNYRFKGRYQVKFTTIPYANETALVNSALSSHKEPNLLEMSLTIMTPYALDHLFAPIGPLLNGANVNPTKDFPKGLWDASQIHGQHYLAPNGAIPTVLFYNKALFEKAGLNPNDPPVNGKQLIADAKKLTNTSKGQWGYVEEPTGGGMNYSIQSAMFQYGVQLANASTGKVTFNKSGTVAAVNFFRNLIWKYHVSPTNASPNEAHDLFVKGQNAMEMTGTYDYAIYKAALGKNLGVALMPKIGPRPLNFLGQNYWGAFQPTLNSGMRTAISRFMEFYYAHSLYIAQQGQIPTWTPTWSNPAFLRLPTYAIQAKAVAEGLPHPPISGYADYMHQYFFPAIEGALLNKTSSAQAVAQAAAGVQSGIKNGNAGA